MRAAQRGGVFEIAIIDRAAALTVLHVTGVGAEDAFRDEAGGHRWQRVPPNDRKRRVQTSTITVAVMREPTEEELVIDPADLEWKWSRGSGAGGQHRNTTASAIDLRHIPTGIVVHAESERSQHQNRRDALSRLRARILADRDETRTAERGAERRAQIGSGMRGDKRRTVRVQDGTVTDHVTGRTWRFRDYARGDF